MPAIIFSRIKGSAHRALVASRTFARLAGSRSASLHFSPATGSAHRAFAIALCTFRALGVVRKSLDLATCFPDGEPFRQLARVAIEKIVHAFAYFFNFGIEPSIIVDVLRR